MDLLPISSTVLHLALLMSSQAMYFSSGGTAAANVVVGKVVEVVELVKLVKETSPW